MLIILLTCLYMYGKSTEWSDPRLYISENFILFHEAISQKALSRGLLSISSVGRKAEYGWTILFWFITLLSTTKKSFPESTCTIAKWYMFMFMGDNYQNCFFTYNIINDGWKFQWEFELLHRKFYWMWTRLSIQKELPKPPQLV